MCDVEQRVLRRFEEKLFTPKLVEAATSAFREDFSKSHGARDAERSKIEREHANVDRKLNRLLRMVEDGHADPAATGPRVNELSAEKRRLAAQLAIQPEGAPAIRIPDEVAAYRQTLASLRIELADGSEPALEASRLVRTFVRRVVVLPGGDGGDQLLEIEAGSSINAAFTDQYCEVGCGGWI